MKRSFIFLIKLYQLFISPILGSNKCRYYPTCSEYAIEAIDKKGIFKGSVMTLFRILKCQPFSKGGYDPVDKNKK